MPSSQDGLLCDETAQLLVERVAGYTIARFDPDGCLSTPIQFATVYPSTHHVTH